MMKSYGIPRIMPLEVLVGNEKGKWGRFRWGVSSQEIDESFKLKIRRLPYAKGGLSSSRVDV